MRKHRNKCIAPDCQTESPDEKMCAKKRECER